MSYNYVLTGLVNYAKPSAIACQTRPNGS